MALTMDQILRRTTRDRLEKARTTVKVTKLKLGVSKRTRLATAIARVYSLDRVKSGVKRNRYVTSISFYAKRKVKVSCSCPDFCFMAEYALWKKGSADLVYSNGEPPVDKNPRMIPMACKHLAAFWFYLDEKDLVKPAEDWANKTAGRRR